MFKIFKREHHLSILVILLAALISSAHILALSFSLYWILWWFDIPMHFFGGLWVALTSFWLYITIGSDKNPSKRCTALIVLLGVFIVGIGWEIFEYASGLSLGENFILDTTIDLIMDVLGGGLGLFYLLSNANTQNESR